MSERSRYKSEKSRKLFANDVTNMRGKESRT